MTTDKAPDCSGCRWFREGICTTAGIPLSAFAERHSREEYRCGPAGKYYEPRDEK